MKRPVHVAVLSIGVLAGLFAPSDGQAQVLAKTLLFNSVQPCRIADTRSATAGILTAGVPRTFNVVGATDYSGQGGVPGGCAIPGFVGGLPQVQAVAINVVAVNPSGDGFLTAWPTDQAFPPASTVNFQKLVPNLNLANGVIVPVRQDVQGGDITIVAGGSDAHVIIDIAGYFSKAALRKYYLTTTPVMAGQALSACAVGYHMASLWEIFDTANLLYNTALGFTRTDSGSGPPVSFQGWIRTGNATSNTNTAGLGNCSAWTSNASAGRGSIAWLEPTWSVASITISPWDAGSQACDSNFLVWCVEN